MSAIMPRQENGRDVEVNYTLKNRRNGSTRRKDDKEKNSLVECCCNDTWVEFTQNTTLHGLKYIWLPGTFFVRRLLWLGLTLAGCGIMGYQIIDRIIYFYDWPVTVNVEVNYNKTLIFPTLTICNQNAFRASMAAHLGHYQLLTDMYSGNDFSYSNVEEANVSDLTLRDIFSSTAHTMEDLIVSCTWRGQECGIHNFTQTITDHGVCYSFNLPDISNHDSHDILKVVSPGAENGLSLTLNVEQYEYMPGPHDAAGVKVLIHDHRQFPKVQELGIALPTGTHSFVGMKLISVENLPAPHGECMSPRLDYFLEYSIENCEVDCFTKYLFKTCGCRLYFMPDISGVPPVCTLKQHYSCYYTNLDKIRQDVRNICTCPVPCKFHIFDPTVSYATTSTFVIDRFLSDTNRSALAYKYQTARDITNRLQRSRVELLKSQLDTLHEKYQTLKDTIINDLKVKVTEQKDKLMNISKSFLWNWTETNTYFQYQNYILQKNLVRARDAMNERTFSVLAHGVQEFTFSVETKIRQLVDPEIDNPGVRQTLFLITKNQLNSRMDIAKRALQNYTQLITGFLNSTSIFNYKFQSFRRNNSDLVLPKQLLLRAFTRSRTIRKRALKVEKDIYNMAKWMKQYGNIAKGAFYNITLNETHLYTTNVMFLWSAREYLQSKSMFFNDFMQWPVSQLDLRERDFLGIKDDFIHLRDSTYGYLLRVSAVIENISETLLKDMSEGIRMCRDYLNFGNISKLDIARHFTSSEVHKGVNDLKLFFETVRSRGQNIYDSWNHLSLVAQKMWNFTLNQVDLKRIWEFHNISRYLRNYTDVEQEIKEEYSKQRDMIDVRCKFHNKDEEFLQSLESLMEHMKRFYDTSHVDSSFVRENFLKLNVFYRELSYEKITQQRAYNIFALLCDIGGSMGLFIGASVLTIFEILDLLVYHTFVRTTTGSWRL